MRSHVVGTYVAVESRESNESMEALKKGNFKKIRVKKIRVILRK